MIVIIAGGREFTNYRFFKTKVLHLLSNTELSTVTIVSGGAKGADSLAIQLAEELSVSYNVFEADWDTHGKAAGPIRNRQMAEFAENEFLICFWDGKSRGTKNMIDTAKKYNITTRIVRY